MRTKSDDANTDDVHTNMGGWEELSSLKTEHTIASIYMSERVKSPQLFYESSPECECECCVKRRGCAEIVHSPRFFTTHTPTHTHTHTHLT